ncbi:cytochrome P450 [Aureobasidium pullulans EXF-150]|uniref:Cytochrome P450 n=1 Tax=Aureobasidium pullulans EXF-150 TaxID=1043002 RepID=A0A074XBR8_AURPU|nr:cytochrome P450 [Aureobasidium pullulans EXF-150]KEQ81134.1 cytochrome P450 [Aureobasidium pullulans EXF-150]
MILFADYAWMLHMHRRLPPGPVPLPLVGNTHMLPENKPWIYFEALAKKFDSPVITFWIGRNPTIWINDAWAASELLDKKAALYASRPKMLVFAELSGVGQYNLVNMRYGDRWRVHRKLTHQGVGLQQVRKYRGFQNNESQVMAYDILHDPKRFVTHMERYATSVVSIIGFGRRVASISDPLITQVLAIMQRAAELNVPGKSFPMIMETFPWLAKFPRCIAPWLKPFGKGGRGSAFYYALADEANRTSHQEPCYVKQLFKEAPKYDLNATEIASLTGNLFGAGSDTSSSTLVTFALACCAFPETLPAAWEELDRVVGPDRSPSWEDEPHLPYVKAFVKEVFRWRSVAIIGGQPHSPTEDDQWNGYLIPKNSWVQGNTWAIHHNEREFPEPDRFNPGRFLSDGSDSRPFPNDKGYMTFGWGRRVCSGQGLAEQGTFISIARLLWAFRIQKAKDETGQDIPVDIFAYTNGLNMRPEPFNCSITPRSETIRETIVAEGKHALAELSVYDGETKYTLSQFFEKPNVG